MIIALSVGMRLILSPLTATLEAFQRFDLVNRAYISALVFRSVGSLTVILAGYGHLRVAVGQLSECLESVTEIRRLRRGRQKRSESDIDFSDYSEA